MHRLRRANPVDRVSGGTPTYSTTSGIDAPLWALFTWSIRLLSIGVLPDRVLSKPLPTLVRLSLTVFALTKLSLSVKSYVCLELLWMDLFGLLATTNPLSTALRLPLDV